MIASSTLKLDDLNITALEEMRGSVWIYAFQQGADTDVVFRQLLQDWLKEA